MAIFEALSVSNLNISDTSTGFTKYNALSSDTLLLYDNIYYYDIFKDNVYDNISITDYNTIINSEYIKTIHGDNIALNDVSSSRADYYNKIIDNIQFNDDSSATIQFNKDTSDALILNDVSYSGVTYRNNIANDQLVLSDSVMSIVSRLSTRRFKNASYNLLGTVEEIIYTCSGISATILNISMCNRILSDIKASVLLYKSGIPIYIIKDLIIKPHQSYVINNSEENSINLELNDEIRIVTDTINSSDVYMAITEQI